MNVALWTWGSLALNTLGANISIMGSLFGRDWIGEWRITASF